MQAKRDYEEEILDLLQRKFGATQSDLSSSLSISRITVKRYLEGLEAEGMIYKEKFGPISVYHPCRRKGDEVFKELYFIILEALINRGLTVRQLKEILAGMVESRLQIAARVTVPPHATRTVERVGMNNAEDLCRALLEYHFFPHEGDVGVTQGLAPGEWKVSVTGLAANKALLPFHQELVGFLLGDIVTNVVSGVIPLHSWHLASDGDTIESILAALQEANAGLTTSDLTRVLGSTRQTVKKHLKRLVGKGLVRHNKVGPYVVYKIVKKDAVNIHEGLYMYLLAVMGGASIDAGFGADITNGKSVRQKFSSLALPMEEKLAKYNSVEVSPDRLTKICKHVKIFMLSLVPFLENPAVDVLPPLGEPRPLTRIFEWKIPDFLLGYAPIHLSIITRLIQVKLEKLTGTDFFLNMTSPLVKNSPSALIELGLVERYVQDFTVHSFDDRQTTEDEILGMIKEFFKSAAARTAINYFESQGARWLHVSFLNNRDAEEMYAISALTLKTNYEIAKEMVAEGATYKREWVSFENWETRPFAVVDCKTNMGGLLEDFSKFSLMFHKKSALCIHWEIIEGGWRLSFKEKVDFLNMWLPMMDFEGRFKSYAVLTDHAAEFVKRRNAALIRNSREMKSKRRA